MAQAAPPSPPPPPPPPPPFAPLFPPRRHKQPHEDLLGLAGFAFFLIAVATVFAMNPNLFPELGEWNRLAVVSHTVFVRPPEGVIVSAAWFFVIVGGLEFVMAALRFALRWLPLRVTSRVLTGIGDLMFATLLFGYAARAISGAFLITVLVGTFAALLMIHVTLGFYWSTVRPVRGIPASQPQARP